jgi:hypothetical protein
MYKLLSILSVLIIISTVPFVSSGSMLGEFTVPDWIKNTAGWWASDHISDSAFLQGIQYLIKEGIMVVEIPTEIDSEAAEEIPGWIKNTAGWWAEDKIHDTTFVSGIEYLIGKGIIIVEQEVEVEESVEEVVEVRDFYMELNGANCCTNWVHVGEEYKFQIETFDDSGSPIDGVTITVKIISSSGELRQNLGEVTTEDGIYNNSVTIPSMDWYAGNILSVTGEYYGVEKTIEKEFEVFKEIGKLSNYGAGAGSCAHVSPVSVASQEEDPRGIAFSKSGTKMFIVGNDPVAGGSSADSVHEYTLTGAYCIGTASFVDSFNHSSQDTSSSDVAFSKSGTKMFVIGSENDNVNAYTLTTAWDVSSASFVDSFSVRSEETSPSDVAFSKSGAIMFVIGSGKDNVNAYTLTTAWDVSTASLVDSFSILDQDTISEGITFSKSGTKMFMVGNTSPESVYQYTLTTAWDVSSASFVDSINISSQSDKPRDIWFDSSGMTMFLLESKHDKVHVYKLTTAWDISTASVVS